MSVLNIEHGNSSEVKFCYFSDDNNLLDEERFASPEQKERLVGACEVIHNEGSWNPYFAMIDKAQAEKNALEEGVYSIAKSNALEAHQLPYIEYSLARHHCETLPVSYSPGHHQMGQIKAQTQEEG